MKISHHGFVPDLQGKKCLEWGKKSLYGALSKLDKSTCAKFKESDWIKLAIIQIKLWVKAAVIANMLESFLKKLGTDSGRCKQIPPKSSALWR